jgi:hypothetical protein
MKSQKNNKNKIFISLFDTSNVPTGYELVLYEDINTIPEKSIQEIFITDLLDYHKDNEINTIIQNISSKLIHTGKLHVQSIDLEQFCIYMVNRVISIDSKYLLFGGKTNIHTLSSIGSIILNAQKEFRCLSRKYINGFEYYLELELK